MKKKIKLFISIFIIMQFIFILKSIAVSTNTGLNYTTEQKALREVIDAYYQKSINIQYCSFRLSRFYSPEDATSQHNIYSVCSDFTFSVYYQTFGIKNPQNTHKIIAYADKYFDKDNIKTNDIIEYWKMTKDENGNRFYQDNKGNIKSINLLTKEGRNEYVSVLLKNYDLQVGDIICYHTGVANSNEGHVLMVYEIIYNELGEPVDAIIRDSSSKYEKKTTKITKGLSFADILNENNNIHEGTFKESYLASQYNTSSNITRNPIVYSFKDMSYFAILRPLLKDENGNYTGKYYFATFKSQTGAEPTGYICTGRTLTNYEITTSTESRINYSKIDIEKTVNVFNNSLVNLGDELEYTIKIINNSSAKYNSFDVIENISDYVEITDKGNGIINNNTIMWNITELENGKSIEIKYKVKVKKDKAILGKELKSTGTVANIPSATITNTISNSLNEEQQKNISSKTQTILNTKSSYGQELISKIYNETYGVDLNLKNLNITDLVKVRNGTVYYPANTTNTPTIYLNNENTFSNMVASNYFGGLYTNSEGIVYLKSWENISYIGSRSERADTIYKENFQTGDILVYQNTQDPEGKDVTYKKEDGTYYLIYISENDKIAVDRDNFHGFIGIDEHGEIKKIETDYTNMQTLLGKDYYVILRPAMTIDLIQMELDVNYNTTNKTNQNVTVTITSNEKVLPIEGWTLSEDELTLTKTYSSNSTENLEVYDYAGNKKTTTIQINNIDKEKPILDINYSTTTVTNKDVVVTINSNEEIENISGWTLSENRKTLTKTYSENTTDEGEEITIKDLAGNETKVTIKISNILLEYGDLNENHKIDIGDIIILLRNIAQENNSNITKEHPEWKLNDKQKKIGDVNKNEKIDIGDLIKLLRFIAATNSEKISKENPTWKDL